MWTKGLTIVRGLRDRHDGERRNPWNEFECGNHYARAMASWSLLLALSGYHYSAPARQIAFAPVVSAENFRCFFSTGSGWGSFAQNVEHGALTATLELRGGNLRLQRIGLCPPAAATRVSVTRRGEALAAHLEPANAGVVVVLEEGLELSDGEMIEVSAGIERLIPVAHSILSPGLHINS